MSVAVLGLGVVLAGCGGSGTTPSRSSAVSTAVGLGAGHAGEAGGADGRHVVRPARAGRPRLARVRRHDGRSVGGELGKPRGMPLAVSGSRKDFAIFVDKKSGGSKREDFGEFAEVTGTVAG